MLLTVTMVRHFGMINILSVQTYQTITTDLSDITF